MQISLSQIACGAASVVELRRHRHSAAACNPPPAVSHSLCGGSSSSMRWLQWAHELCPHCMLRY